MINHCCVYSIFSLFIKETSNGHRQVRQWNLEQWLWKSMALFTIWHTINMSVSDIHNENFYYFFDSKDFPFQNRKKNYSTSTFYINRYRFFCLLKKYVSQQIIIICNFTSNFSCFRKQEFSVGKLQKLFVYLLNFLTVNLTYLVCTRPILYLQSMQCQSEKY